MDSSTADAGKDMRHSGVDMPPGQHEPDDPSPDAPAQISEYDVEGHVVKVGGVDVTGAVLVSINLADHGSCEPWGPQPEPEAAPLQHRLQRSFSTHEHLKMRADTVVVPPAAPIYQAGSMDLEGVRTLAHSQSMSASRRQATDMDSDAATTPASYHLSSLDSPSEQDTEAPEVTGMYAKAARIAEAQHAAAHDTDATSRAAVSPESINTEGHGPFAHIPLEPADGAHCICLLVVGTRGDVQPFIAIARELLKYGHRVRLATHAVYRKFVEGNGVEFYPIGGDPAVLSEFVVRNRGILPGGGGKTLMQDVQEQGKELRDIIFSSFGACVDADPERPQRPFQATAIIANPPSGSYVVLAEKLQIPCHVMFTMPWTPTKEFPHPMAVVKSVNVASAFANVPTEFVSGGANWYSYKAMDMYLWTGVSGIIDKFRKHLDLPSYSRLGAVPAHATDALRLPITYLWSPSLQPRASDWGEHIAVTGFVFLEADSQNYEPPEHLAAFMDTSLPPPIYIGFGSLILNQPKETTEMVYQAVRESGKRVLLSRGWACLGDDVPNKPDNVFILGNCPHGWLFPRCSAVVHHGGAGTTAAGLLAALPTLVIPFFGDQPFWGACCHKAGLGPKPVPIARLTKNDLLAAFEAFEDPKTRANAKTLSEQMVAEDGLQDCVAHFHECLDKHKRIIPIGATKLQSEARPLKSVKHVIEELMHKSANLPGLITIPSVPGLPTTSKVLRTEEKENSELHGDGTGDGAAIADADIAAKPPAENPKAKRGDSCFWLCCKATPTK